MRQHTAKGDRRADQRVEFLVATDGQLQVAGRDALDFEVFGGIAGEFEDFGGEVLEDGGDVDGGCRICRSVKVLEGWERGGDKGGEGG